MSDSTPPGKSVRVGEERILGWLEPLGLPQAVLHPLPGDVSPRRYFRVQSRGNEDTVLAVYPVDELPALVRFLATSRLFEEAGIRIPRVLASDNQAGLMLLEDLGTASVFDQVQGPWPELLPHLEAALEAMKALAEAPARPFDRLNPRLDAQRLTLELRDAQSVFLDSSDFSGSAAEREGLYTALDHLAQALVTEPLVPSHRDFMSRNLMLPPDGSGPAVIDHQDACLAPRHYDLASLLNDSLFLSRSQEDQLLGPIRDDSESLTSYRRCAVQRAIKATATYVKFALRGFDRHLTLVAPTLARAVFQLQSLPEAASVPSSVFARWLDAKAIDESVGRLVRAHSPTPPAARC